MRSRLYRMTAPAALAIGLSFAAAPAFAQSQLSEFQKGVQAFDAGDYKKAVSLWEPLADDGNVEALRNLAQLYRLGLGVQQSDAKAFELYEQAAQRGLAAAQVNAAFLLLTGKGVEQDRKQAAVWFGKAADQGNPLAQYNLGLMYEKGIGVDQSDELAVELYQAAADQGQKRAIARLEAMDAADATKTAEVAKPEPAKAEPEKAEPSETAEAPAKTDDAAKTKRPRPSMAEIGEAVKATSEMADADAGAAAKRPRPAKEEIAAAIKRATDAARKASGGEAAGLSMQPASKPLEFETLDDGAAPKEAYVITFDAQDGSGPKEAYVVKYDAPEGADGETPQEAYVVRFDANDDGGTVEKPEEAYVIRFDAPAEDNADASREAYVVKYDAKADAGEEILQEAYVVKYDAKADAADDTPREAYVMEYDANADTKTAAPAPKNPDLSIQPAAPKQPLEQIETVVYTPEAGKNSEASSSDLTASTTPRQKPALPSTGDNAPDAKASEQPAEAPRASAPAPTTKSARVSQVKEAEAAYRNGNYRKAASLLEPLAIDGMPVAQFWLGRLYNRGEGVPLDRSTAYVLWRLAASGGSDNAATALANLSVRLSPEEIAFAEQRLAAMQ